MQEFIAFAVANGFEIQGAQLDGKIHRFPRGKSKDSAWYIGYQNHGVRSGKTYVVAIFGDWKTGERHEYKPSGKDISQEDRDIAKKQIAAAVIKAAEEKKLRQLEAADKAERFWHKCQDVPDSDYLTRKKLPGLFGAKSWKSIIVVPVRDEEDRLWGLQYIQPDGEKRFMSGQRIEGCFHQIGKPDDSAFICEGYATGASIHLATKKAVFCAFNAGNLVNVAKALHKKYPEVRFTIAGDDDKFNEINVGRDKATKAAMQCQGSVKFPEFANEETKPTDFNDLHCLEGLAKITTQLEEPKECTDGFIALGFDESVHFYYVFSGRCVVKVTSYTDVQLLQLARLEYWQDAYPGKNGANWQQAKDDLINKTLRAGPFNVFRVRGTGVWLDDGRIVINDGKALNVESKPVPMTSFDSRFVYIQTRNRMPPIAPNPLSVAECDVIRDACISLSWRDDKSGYLLAGWLAIARIASALPVRPHVWLTGGSGTGKSTVMDRIVRNALGCDAGKLYLQGGSTEAGVRQAIKADCLPIIFDEFETNDDRTKERVAALVELLRQSWSSTQGYIVKGSANGIATQYALNFAALVSSIRVNLQNDADRSRFSVLELMPHGSNPSQWRELNQRLKAVNETYGERLFARSCSMVKKILANYEAISAALATVVSQRFGQQYGMLLAGYYSLLSNEAITDDHAERLVSSLDFREEKADVLTDEAECLTSLITNRIRLCIDVEMSIADAINSNSEFSRTVLRSYGILVQSDAILVANKHSALAQIFGRTRWIDWKKSLIRLPGATSTEGQWFGKIKSRCVKIPRSLIS